MTQRDTNQLLTGFLPGLFWKTLLLGALAALAIGWYWPIWLGVSVMTGAGLAAVNAAAIGWLARQIVLSNPDETSGIRKATIGWAVLLGIKMLLLLVLAFVAVAVFRVDPLGLAIGYTAFVLATCWQAFVTFDDQPSRDPGEHESDPPDEPTTE